MKTNEYNKLTIIVVCIWIVLIVAVTILLPSNADACCSSIVYTTDNYTAGEILNQPSDKTDEIAARSTAAGQHHYKATTDLQWSVGSGFAGDETALSFGLGYQAGDVFVSGNITDTIFSGESDPVVGVGASGTF